MVEIYAKVAAIMADIEAIGKNSKNEQQGFKYRGIDGVYNAIHPLLAKHGVFTTPEVLEKSRTERTNSKGTVLAFTCLRMRYTFWAADGSSVSCVVEGEGMDSGDKSSNKAMAVAHKYALLQTFCVPTEDMKDPDAETHTIVGLSLEDEAHRRELVESLEEAAGGGHAVFAAAWKALPQADRELVGKDKFTQLKAGIKDAA